MNLFTAKIINTETGQLLTAIHADTQEKLQQRYSDWKRNAKGMFRLAGFHVVLTKDVCIDREWVMVSSRVGKIDA